MKKRKVRQILAMLLSMVLIMTTIVSPSATVFATTATNETRSITLDVKSKVTMYVGTSRKIKVKTDTSIYYSTILFSYASTERRC